MTIDLTKIVDLTFEVLVAEPNTTTSTKKIQLHAFEVQTWLDEGYAELRDGQKMNYHGVVNAINKGFADSYGIPLYTSQAYAIYTKTKALLLEARGNELAAP